MKSSDYQKLLQSLQSNSPQDLNMICRGIVCDDLTESSSFWYEHSKLLQVLLSYTCFENESIDVNDKCSKAITIVVPIIVTGLFSLIPSLNFWILFIISCISVSIILPLTKIVMKSINQLLTKIEKIMGFGQQSSGNSSTLQNHELRLSAIEKKINKLEKAYQQLPELLEKKEEAEGEVSELKEKLHALEEECNTLKTDIDDLREIKKNFEDALCAIVNDYNKIHKPSNKIIAEFYEDIIEKLTTSTRYRLLFYNNDKSCLQYFKCTESDYISELNETPALIIYNTKGEIVDCLQAGKLSFPTGQMPTE